MTRATILVCVAVMAGCFGDKIFSQTGGGGSGAATHSGGTPNDGGQGAVSTNGGATGEGGSSSSKGGSTSSDGGAATECDAGNEGAPCVDQHPCADSTCVSGTCTVTSFTAPGTVIQDNGISGDCEALVCNGTLADPVSGDDDTDVPMPPDECTVGQCLNGQPTTPQAQLGTTCSGGVCSDQLGCTECVSWANCSLGEICLNGACSACQANFSCSGNPAGKQCQGGTCGCITGSYCGEAPSGTRCINNIACGCITGSDCNGVAFGPICKGTMACGCNEAANCSSSSLGSQCVSEHCGCNTNADCGPGKACDVSSHLCF